MPAPATRPPPARHPLLLAGLAFLGGVAVAVLAPLLTRLPAPAVAANAGPSLAQVEAAVAPALDAARRAEEQAVRAEALSTRAEAAAQRLEGSLAQRGPQGDRFLAAALLLQSSIATPRPWLRELQTMADLAPAGALPRPVAEVLMSHAARGLPSEPELRERFAALMPQLIARAPQPGGLLDQGLGLLRGGFAAIGLAAPPPPSDQEVAIGAVAQQLRRGNLAGAVADAAALDAGLQPLLAGWLAQARARLAVEQAVQETLLRALSGTGATPPGLTPPGRPS
ncbi:hypothetical protein [Falsiroseomonas stagni]|nr:hypothetical protein [Falsiroseomonas stagni]